MSNLIFPPELKQGDSIGLIAPAFPIKKSELDLSKKIIEELGYNFVPGECVVHSYNIHGYLAGAAAKRANDLNNMFLNPIIKAIFCVRGGYGSSHIIPFLDYEMICKNPKIFVGYSDITNVHVALQQFCNLVTFYGPMVSSNMISDFDDYSKNSLFTTINWKESNLLLHENPKHINLQTIKSGYTRGIITGGNLSLLTRACGTFFQLNAENKILFLEDIDESIPLLDMYITQMEYAGVFKGVKGIILGDFTGCDNCKYDSSYTIDDFFKERFINYDFPIISHFSSGHNKPMATVPLGVMCSINTDENKIIFEK